MEAWYVLEDGSLADPAEVRNENGVLVHDRGRVALRPSGVPFTRGTSEEQRLEYRNREAKPARGYKTRAVDKTRAGDAE